MHLREKTIAWFDRFSAIPGLLLTSSVCYTLLALQLSGYRSSEGLSQWLKANNTATAIGVQVLSHVLGLVHVQVVCSLLKSTFVLSLRTRLFPLYEAQFVQAAAIPRMTWDLPWRLSMLLLLLVVFSFFPAAMWAGALAPISSERNIIQSMSIPTFDIKNASALWDGNASIAVLDNQWMSDQGGLFSFDTAASKALMLSSASDASILTEGVHKHAKLDKTGFAYINRSYGAGSIAGFNQFTHVTTTNWFTYKEDGFDTSISCFHNTSNLYGIDQVPLYKSDGYGYGPDLPGMFQATGTLANGQPGAFTTYLAYLKHDMFVWAASYIDATRTLAIQLVTPATAKDDPWGFGSLNGIQCNIEFKPQTFSVLVNTTSKLVTSTPLNSPNLKWPTYGDEVTNMITKWVGEMTLLDEGCIRGCQIGRSLVLNVRQLQNVTRDASNSTVLKGVQDFMTSVTDNIMVNLLLTRMVSKAPQPTKNVDATIGVPAVCFGDLKFIIIVVAINIALSLAYVLQFVRTRAWAGIPDFDLTNICSVLISACRGGMALERSSEKVEGAMPHKESFTARTKMCLKYDESMSTQPILIPLLDLQLSPSHLDQGADGAKSLASISEDSQAEEEAFLTSRNQLPASGRASEDSLV